MEILFSICPCIWNSNCIGFRGKFTIQTLRLHWHPNRHLCNNNARYGRRWLYRIFCLLKEDRQLQESITYNCRNKFLHDRRFIIMAFIISRFRIDNSYCWVGWILLYTDYYVVLWFRVLVGISDGRGTSYRYIEWWVVVFYVLDDLDYKLGDWIREKVGYDDCDVCFYGVFVGWMCTLF